jgi:hypothetical protein
VWIPGAPLSFDAHTFTSDGAGRFLDDPRRYPAQAEAVSMAINAGCAQERFDDGWGYWIVVVFHHC